MIHLKGINDLDDQQELNSFLKGYIKNIFANYDRETKSSFVRPDLIPEPLPISEEDGCEVLILEKQEDLKELDDTIGMVLIDEDGELPVYEFVSLLKTNNGSYIEFIFVLNDEVAISVIVKQELIPVEIFKDIVFEETLEEQSEEDDWWYIGSRLEKIKEDMEE